jgi:hypothetical protein
VLLAFFPSRVARMTKKKIGGGSRRPSTWFI